MKAMIFAAGLGSRLKPLTDTCPKALITVAGKPMLEHVILKLKAAGFDEIVINVHHLAHQILAFLEANNNFGIHIRISDETDELLDTGGGLEKAARLLCPSGPEHADEAYLIHNVDILSNCQLENLMRHHRHTPGICATLLVSRRKTSRYLLFDDDNLLCGWVNKNTLETKPAGFQYEEGKYREYAYSGIQVVSPELFKHLPKGKYSIVDFYLSACRQIKVQGYVEDDLQLIDIGKPETLEKAEEFLGRL